jgi:hypothetical protein
MSQREHPAPIGRDATNEESTGARDGARERLPGSLAPYP